MTGYKKCQVQAGVLKSFFSCSLGLLSVKTVLSDGKEGIAFAPNRKEMVDFINSIGFTLTNAQKRVWEEIEKDMESNRVMNRLVQGMWAPARRLLRLCAG